MNIIEYDSKYDEDIKDLLLELQQYIASIDKDKYNIVTKHYREEEFKETIKEVLEKEGKIFLARDNNKIVGLIIGIINNNKIHTYNFTAPKRGRITELIVSKHYRSTGIGQVLLNKMENYFKSVGCKAILISVFGYNEIAKNFYYKNNYYNRSLDVMKKI